MCLVFGICVNNEAIGIIFFLFSCLRCRLASITRLYDAVDPTIAAVEQSSRLSMKLFVVGFDCFRPFGN